MSNPTRTPATAEALVRAHFGLSQLQLARYLGVSAGFVAHLEAGRKAPAATTVGRLTPLAALLPPPEGSGSPAAPVPAATAANPAALPDGPATPLAPEPLRRRQLACRLQAALLTQRLLRLQKRAAALTRCRRGLAQLRAAVAPTAPAEAARYARWLMEQAEDLAFAKRDPAVRAATQVLLAPD